MAFGRAGFCFIQLLKFEPRYHPPLAELRGRHPSVSGVLKQSQDLFDFPTPFRIGCNEQHNSRGHFAMKRKIVLLAAVVLAGILPLMGMSDEMQPGDKGYKHNELHNSYQELFTSMKCSCGVGECRATVWKYSKTSPHGYAVKIDGNWYDLQQDTKLVNPDAVSTSLKVDPAHVCAYGFFKNFTIPCALINRPYS